MRVLISAVLSGLVVAVGAAGLWSAVSEAGGGGGGCHGPLTDGAAAEIEIVQNCFGPTVARVDPGATVTWTNRDAAPHNVYAPGQAWSTGQTFGKGEGTSAVFDTAGVFPYVCSVHPGMVGVIVVGDGVSAAAAPYAPPNGQQISALAGPGSAKPTHASEALSPIEPATAAISEGDGGRTVAFAGVALAGSLLGVAAFGLVVARRR